MFRLLKILSVTTSSALIPSFKMQCLVRSTAPIAIRSKSATSKSSSTLNSKSKGKNKPEPSCKRNARKKNCSKVPAPSPSYSECRREPAVPKPPTECDCGDFDKC